ncbi:MAG: hypothetical protein PHT57_09165 [Rhodoferax sp.]|nr:hypothetical protein [Rhodoferax sp.]
MSDLTMAKIRALYEDMVLMEKNMKTMEQKMHIAIERLEKKVSVPRAYGSNSMPFVVVVALTTFILGLAFALAFSRPWWVSIGLVLPGLAFIFLTWLWIEKGRHQPPAHAAYEKPVAGMWTQEQFQSACLTVRPKIEGKNQDACRDVVFGGMTAKDAATKHQLSAIDVQRCIRAIACEIF